MSDFNPTAEPKLEGAGADTSRPPQAWSAPERVLPLSESAILLRSNEAFNNSVNYFNASHRNRIISAMARFNSEHPKESKYWSEAFKRRSRTFRPKTRSVVRRREAAAVVSMFASSDVVNVRPSSDGADAALDARIQESLLNYRMQEDDRWYKFVAGAVQDADRQGFVIAKTYWEYEEAAKYWERPQPLGLSSVRGVDFVATKDRPGFQLVPIERFFFSPAADWVNPIESSPYLIEVMPMFVCDIRKHEKNTEAKLKYRSLSDSQLLSGGHMAEWNPIRLQRERNRLDRYDRGSSPTDYAVAWVHRNILNIEGEDYVFDTVGEGILLSDIVPLSVFDPRGYRPYVVGSTLFEAHNPFNVGTVTLMGQMQDEINDTANLRMDANKMSSAGRMFIKRNTSLDLHALARFSPGATVEMDNPQQDVKWDRPNPPPPQMMEENQLLNTELDDLIGNFSPTSLRGTENLNGSDGAMEVAGMTADQLTEYDLQTLVKSFLQPVLGQILDLEKHWESSANLVTIIGKALAVDSRRFWQSLDTETKVWCNVGFGATNPAKRMQRILGALQATTQISPMLAFQSNQSELLKEVWACAGIDDVSRFFPFAGDQQGQKQDPKVQALQEQLMTMVMRLYPGEMHNQGWMFREQIRGQANEKIEQMKANNAIILQHLQAESALKLKQMETQLAYVQLQLEHEKNDIARGNLMVQRERLSNDISVQRTELEIERETATASANPPDEPALSPQVTSETNALNIPGSNVPPSPFPAAAATAAMYAKRSMPPPPQQGPVENTLLAQPLFVPPNSLGAPPGYPGFQPVGGKFYSEKGQSPEVEE